MQICTQGKGKGMWNIVFRVQQGPKRQFNSLVRMILDLEVVRAPGSGGGFHQVVSEKEISYVGKIKFRITSLRRHGERPVVNASMEEEMRQLCARLDDVGP
jgi:hypothetical protein